MKKIDIHSHYGKWYFLGADATLEDFEKSMEKFEVEAFFISSAVALVYDFVEGNRDMFDAISNRKGMYGYVAVNAHYPEESLQEIKKYMGHPKFIGVKYHPSVLRKSPDCEELKRIYEFIEKEDIPIKVHTGGGGDCCVSNLLNVNRQFPGLKIIAAHMGQGRYDLGIETAKRSNGNIFLEICATCIASDKLRPAVDAVGKDRIMYGTDYALFSPSYTIGAVESAGLTEDEKEHIYKLNALRVFTRCNM